MRTVFVLLLAAVCALAVPVQKEVSVADKVLLEKQRDILLLFNYINQPSYYKEFIDIADTFKFEGHWEQWTKPQYAKQFWHFYQHDILPQGEVFSVFYPKHLEQAIALFRTLYYAKDYPTFFKTAVWARQNVNEGMFVYALAVAVVHAEQHLEYVMMPPIQEILPQYFFNDEVIHKALQYNQHYWGTYEHENEIKDAEYKGYTIHANYSGWYVNVHPEQSMTYFTEDVGINAYYYYRHIISPWWMEKHEMLFDTLQRGEYYYYYHQQLLARYYLERLSNDMGEIPHYSYNAPIETGYYPSLTHANGLHFPSRPNHANLYYHGVHGQQSYSHYGNTTYSYTYVMDYERRLRDALDMGYIYTQDGEKVNLFDKDGFETLGSLVESNAQSPNQRFYGDLQVFARHLLGYSYYPLDQYKVVPSALEHFETSLRDPMFWQMYKRMMYYFHQHQNYQGPYEKEQLYWNGVKIQSVEVDRLMTYFDYDYTDIANIITVDEKQFNKETFKVRARQYRLNHKPFNYKITVDSDKITEAFVKVFIGPKYDEYGREIHMNQNRINFFELDRFQTLLNTGENVIERNSHDSVYFTNDRTGYAKLYQQVMDALDGSNEYKYYEQDVIDYGFPHRYMLPKGDFGGKTYQFYVIVAPYNTEEKQTPESDFFVNVEYAMGYPFDRPIEFEHEFFVPNSYAKDVVIYHKNTEEEYNTVWSRN